MQLADERVDVLLACLRQNLRSEDMMPLRALIWGDPDVLTAVLIAADRRMVGAALVEALEQKGILHASTARGSARAKLAEIKKRHAIRWETQREAICEITAALNDRNIHPLLMKGAAALFNRAPAWRFQRDIDFAIEPDEIDGTLSVLNTLGYRVQKQMSPRHHHLDTMVRPDPDIAIEPHTRLNGRRSSRIVGHLPMEETAQRVVIDGMRVRLLRPEFALLHGLIHHHFENRGNNFGVISIKGLLEFAHQLQVLTEESVEDLLSVLQGQDRLGAAVSLWIAACQSWLGVTVPDALAPAQSAVARFRRIAARLEDDQPPSMLQAAREELAQLFAVSCGKPRHFLRTLRPAAPILLDCIENRPWGGRPRVLKSAGLLAFSSEEPVQCR